MLKLDDQLCFALYAASNAVMRAYRPLLAEMDLTFPQYLVMIALWQHGAAPVSDIAARLKVGVEVISPLVDQLENSGYIYKARGSTGPRVETIVLTATGVQLEEAATEAQRQVACHTGLTTPGLISMRDKLHQMVDRMTLSASSSDGREH